MIFKATSIDAIDDIISAVDHQLTGNMNSNAQNKAYSINEMITALPKGAVAMADADALLLEIEAIYDLIADFYANGSHCTDPCEQCIETYFTIDGVNNILELYRLKASATMASQYKVVYDAADSTTQTDLAVYLTLYNNMFDRAGTIDAIDNVARTAANKLAEYQP